MFRAYRGNGPYSRRVGLCAVFHIILRNVHIVKRSPGVAGDALSTAKMSVTAELANQRQRPVTSATGYIVHCVSLSFAEAKVSNFSLIPKSET